MARTPSNFDLPLGSVCPSFELTCVLCNRALGRDDIFGGVEDKLGRKGVLVAFVSAHCPFVLHMQEAFTAFAKQYAGEIATACICSNDSDQFSEDSPDGMRAQAKALGWDATDLPSTGGCAIPYLHDPSQETAREFHAACTPDLYLFDTDYKLVYHAQFDETRPYRQSDASNGVERHPEIHTAAHGADLRNAIENLLAGKPPLAEQRPSLGCNIKWR